MYVRCVIASSTTCMQEQNSQSWYLANILSNDKQATTVKMKSPDRRIADTLFQVANAITVFIYMLNAAFGILLVHRSACSAAVAAVARVSFHFLVSTLAPAHPLARSPPAQPNKCMTVDRILISYTLETGSLMIENSAEIHIHALTPIS